MNDEYGHEIRETIALLAKEHFQIDITKPKTAFAQMVNDVLSAAFRRGMEFGQKNVTVNMSKEDLEFAAKWINWGVLKEKPKKR